MTPAASVSGFRPAHPEARFLNVDRSGEDPPADWVRRMGLEEAEARRGLAALA